MNRSKGDLTRAYQQFCSELSRVLYEEDPARMGTSVGAPHDEYDGEAVRLAAALRDARSDEQVERVLIQAFHGAPARLVERVGRALTKFRWRTMP